VPGGDVMSVCAEKEKARAYWEQLDLAYLADMMCADSYPLPRWNKQDAEQCVRLYKIFLWLNKLYAGAPLVPTREIDECWHNHILHTRQYTADCQQIFGTYLHHTPTQRGENDAALARDYLRTKALYQQEFGEPLGLVIDLSNATP
jgi:hypothetical protein